MRQSIRLVTAGLVVAGLGSLAACGGSSSTPTPPPAPPAPPASAALPSLALPSGITLPSGLTLPSGAAGSVPDASTFVTADMAASVIGGSPQKQALPGLSGMPASIVSYTTAGGDTMTVLIEKLPGGVPAAAFQAAMQMAGAQGDLQAVSGIGDAAGKSVEANGATLAFAKGDSIVVLNAQASAMAGTDLESKLEAVAQQVLGKL